MTTVAHDTPRGIGFAALAAVCFGTSGTLATGLFDSGWSPAGVVLARVLIGGAVLAPLAVRALRGRWSLAITEWRLIAAYGAVVVAFTQFAYFSAVDHLDVAVALLIEYVAPVAVLMWLWARHGEQPTRVTAAGAVLAVGGLTLVLDLFSGAELDVIGVAWGLAAMVGCAMYFVLSARHTDLPPVALASGGLLLGGILLAGAAILGLVQLTGSTARAEFTGLTVPFWIPLLLVGIVSSAMAYVFGIIGTRLLGSRVAAFVSLLEVLAAVVFAWIFVGQQPGPIQLLGGLCILTGIVLVKLGERRSAPIPLGDAEQPALTADLRAAV
jgi:drug/metabolite transporter (DMT)-like permease